MPEPAPIAAFAWIPSHPWLYPVLESLHVVGIALLFGSLLVLELRVWGLSAALPVPALARLALPLSLLGFCVAAGTGLAMFLGQAGELLANRVFVVKMSLVMLAGLNAAAFHARGSLGSLDAVARAQTLVSLGLWVAVIICGRWIAYY
jgi:hypothetical protein